MRCVDRRVYAENQENGGTLTLPSCEPDATISESLEIASAITAVSCIMNLSSAWYCRSFFNFPDKKSHTCSKTHQSPYMEGARSIRLPDLWLFLSVGSTASVLPQDCPAYSRPIAHPQDRVVPPHCVLLLCTCNERWMWRSLWLDFDVSSALASTPSYDIPV